MFAQRVQNRVAPILLMVLLSACDKHESLYKGKPISYWLEPFSEINHDRNRVRAALPALCEALDDPSEEVRGRVAAAIESATGILPTSDVQLFRDAVPVLVESLNKESPRGDPTEVSFRDRVASAIHRISLRYPLLPEIEASAPELANALGHQTWETLFGLGKRAEEAVPVLLEKLEVPHTGTRELAAKVLGSICEGGKSAETERVVLALAQAMSDTAPTVGVAAARSLVLVGPKAKTAIPALLVVAQTPAGTFDERKRQALAIQAMAAVGLDAVPDLIEALDRHPSAAANALGEIGAGARQAVGKLEELTESDEKSVRDSAEAALAKIQGDGK